MLWRDTQAMTERLKETNPIVDCQSSRKNKGQTMAVLLFFFRRYMRRYTDDKGNEITNEGDAQVEVQKMMTRKES